MSEKFTVGHITPLPGRPLSGDWRPSDGPTLTVSAKGRAVLGAAGRKLDEPCVMVAPRDALPFGAGGLSGCPEDAASCDCSWHENKARAGRSHAEPGSELAFHCDVYDVLVASLGDPDCIADIDRLAVPVFAERDAGRRRIAELAAERDALLAGRWVGPWKWEAETQSWVRTGPGNIYLAVVKKKRPWDGAFEWRFIWSNPTTTLSSGSCLTLADAQMAADEGLCGFWLAPQPDATPGTVGK